MTTPEQWQARQWALDSAVVADPYDPSLVDGKPVLKDLLSGNGDLRQPRGKRCYEFDGATDYVHIPNPTHWNGLSALTVRFYMKFWVSRSSELLTRWITPNDKWIIIRPSTDAGGLSAFISTDGTNQFGGSYGDMGLAVNTVAEFIVAWDGASLRVFKDGIESTTSYATTGSQISTVNAESRIGVNHAGANQLAAKVWNLQIFNQYLPPGSEFVNPIASYHMNEEDGTTAYDSSGNANHGTITNATLSTFHAVDDGVTANPANDVGYTDNAGVIIPRNEAIPAEDVLGGTLQYTGRGPLPIVVESPVGTFDGVDDYVICGQADSPGTTGTLCLWHYDDAVSNNAGVAGDCNGSGRGQMAIWQATGDRVRCLIDNGGGFTDIFADIVLGQWQFIALVLDVNEIRVYVDGVLTSGAYSGSMPAAVNEFGMGARMSGSIAGGFSSCRIADVRRYTEALTVNQLEFIRTGSGTQPPTPVRQWSFSEGAGDTVHNVVANANHGTITNATLNDFWQNRTNTVRDHCIEYGGRIGASSEFVPGLIDGSSAADGNPITLLAGHHGNPHSRLIYDYWSVPELGGINYPAESPPGELLRNVAPVNTKFRSETPQTNYIIDTDGTNRRVIVPHDPAYDVTNAMTVGFWVQIFSSVTAGIVDCESGGTGTSTRWAIWQSSVANRIDGYFSNGSNIVAAEARGINYGQWVHVAFTHDAINARAYVNGVQTHSPSAPWNLQQVNKGIVFGAMNTAGTTFPFDGLISDVRHYNRVLDQPAIDAWYRGAFDPTGLIGRWMFDEQAGPVAGDSSITGNDGSVIETAGNIWGGSFGPDGTPFADGDNRLFTLPNTAWSQAIADYIERGAAPPPSYVRAVHRNANQVIQVAMP